MSTTSGWTFPRGTTPALAGLGGRASPASFPSWGQKRGSARPHHVQMRGDDDHLDGNDRHHRGPQVPRCQRREGRTADGPTSRSAFLVRTDGEILLPDGRRLTYA